MILTQEYERVEALRTALKRIRHYIVPSEFPDNAPAYCQSLNKDFDTPYLRSLCTDKGMWALVDLKWTRKLSDWIGKRRTLEIMAGRGWLGRALSYHGTDITCTDRYQAHEIYPVHEWEANKVNMSGYDILIVSWPPYLESDVIEALDKWGTSRPIVYIGEGYGGCCGVDEMHDHFVGVKNAPDIKIPSWEYIHDELRIVRWS